MIKNHHFLCKVSILQTHSPETAIAEDQCDCDFIVDVFKGKTSTVLDKKVDLS